MARSPQAMPPLPWRELWLEDIPRGMAGRPDRVERLAGALRVVDYKTGVRQGAPSEAQHQQLIFYASLTEHVLGELPGTVAVVDAAGTEHVTAVTAAEVNAARERSWSALTALDGSRALEARPSEDNCSTCPYRIVCRGFFEAYQAEWRSGPVRAGRVRELVDLDGRLVVDVDVLAPEWGPRQMRLLGFPFPEDLEAGQVWAFSDFAGPAASGAARWNTLMFRWA